MRQKVILSFFSLEGHPFSKEIKTSELMELPTMERAHEQFNLLLEIREIRLFTGPSGSEKSSLIRKLASEMNPGFSSALGLTPKGRRNASFQNWPIPSRTVSGRILRTVGNVAWKSLIKAYEHKSNVVEKEHVQMVISL